MVGRGSTASAKTGGGGFGTHPPEHTRNSSTTTISHAQTGISFAA
jgi:hypothetical protein